MPKTICLDFDGVCSDYRGWRGQVFLDSPRSGLREFLVLLQAEGYETVIHSTRPPEHILDWLATHGLAELIARVTAEKPPAQVYLDDRGLCFTGDYGDAFRAIQTFKAYWEEG